MESNTFQPKPAHAYIYGKRINGAEENTISKERLEEIKNYLNKYFEGGIYGKGHQQRFQSRL